MGYPISFTTPPIVLNDGDLIRLTLNNHFVKRTDDANSWIQAVDAPNPLPRNYAFTVKIPNTSTGFFALLADNGNYVYRKNDGYNSMAADQANIDPQADANADFWPLLVAQPRITYSALPIALQCMGNSGFLSLPGIRASDNSIDPNRNVFFLSKIQL